MIEMSLKARKKDRNNQPYYIEDDRVFTHLDYVPKLVYPVKEVDKMLDKFSDFLYHNIHFKYYIMGGKGIGKTVNLVNVANQINQSKDVVELEDQNCPFIVYINCKTNSNLKAIMREILMVGKYDFKLNKNVGQKVENHFQNFFKNKKIILILDEVHYIKHDYRRGGASIFHYLMNTNPDSMRISYVFITNSIRWLDEIRSKDEDFDAKLHFSEEEMFNWNSPSNKETKEILKLKVQEGVSGNVPVNLIEEVGDISNHRFDSDIRLAVTTLHEVLKLNLDKKKYDLIEIFRRKRRSTIRKALKDTPKRELFLTYLSNFFDNSVDLLKAYNMLMSNFDLGSEISKSRFMDIIIELDKGEYIYLMKPKIKSKIGILSKIDASVLRDEIDYRYDSSLQKKKEGDIGYKEYKNKYEELQKEKEVFFRGVALIIREIKGTKDKRLDIDFNVGKRK